jgi:hypothetical protein
VSSAQIANQRLSLRGDPPRCCLGAWDRLARPSGLSARYRATQRRTGLPDNAVSFSDRDDRSPGQDFQNGAVSLLDHVQLPKHDRERRASSGAAVSHIKRSRALSPALHFLLFPSDAPIFVKRSSIGITSLRRLADDRVDASRAWLGQDWVMDRPVGASRRRAAATVDLVAER